MYHCQSHQFTSWGQRTGLYQVSTISLLSSHVKHYCMAGWFMCESCQTKDFSRATYTYFMHNMIPLNDYNKRREEIGLLLHSMCVPVWRYDKGRRCIQTAPAAGAERSKTQHSMSPCWSMLTTARRIFVILICRSLLSVRTYPLSNLHNYLHITHIYIS